MPTCFAAMEDARCRSPFSKTGTGAADLLRFGSSKVLSDTRRAMRQKACGLCGQLDLEFWLYRPGAPSVLELLDYIDSYKQGSPQALETYVDAYLAKLVKQQRQLRSDVAATVRRFTNQETSRLRKGLPMPPRGGRRRSGRHSVRRRSSRRSRHGVSQ